MEVIQELADSLGGMEPTPQQLAEATGVKVKEARDILKDLKDELPPMKKQRKSKAAAKPKAAPAAAPAVEAKADAATPASETEPAEPGQPALPSAPEAADPETPPVEPEIPATQPDAVPEGENGTVTPRRQISLVSSERRGHGRVCAVGIFLCESRSTHVHFYLTPWPKPSSWHLFRQYGRADVKSSVCTFAFAFGVWSCSRSRTYIGVHVSCM